MDSQSTAMFTKTLFTAILVATGYVHSVVSQGQDGKSGTLGGGPFMGTAHRGFSDTSNCVCGAETGPFTIAIPSAIVSTAVCCLFQIQLSFNGLNTTVVLSGTYDAGGPQDIALSPDAFAALGGLPGETTLSPVTWSGLPEL
ncbi:hypothetical protein C8R46DRAFT_1218891 [Mycena filopes]|nr:hypothetical protein C8R46DRAFT_1218891 [Mycena filopes]